jgi:hypothetical protein
VLRQPAEDRMGPASGITIDFHQRRCTGQVAFPPFRRSRCPVSRRRAPRERNRHRYIDRGLDTSYGGTERSSQPTDGRSSASRASESFRCATLIVGTTKVVGASGGPAPSSRCGDTSSAPFLVSLAFPKARAMSWRR